MHEEIGDERLLEIIQRVKETHLSRAHFPRLIVGTGLSISYGIAGMEALYNALEEYFLNLDGNDPMLIKWDSIKEIVHNEGLEKGLEDIDFNRDSEFIEVITSCTAKLILNDLQSNFKDILHKESGFKRLLQYLLDTCSANNKVVDIMTPNYDLIIELICDDLGVEIIDGFNGNVVCRYNHALIRSPRDKFLLGSQYKYVRLFKPHGSINWVAYNGHIIRINDFDLLKRNTKNISIIAPGGDKYRQGLTVTVYRNIREEFNNIISNHNNEPILIFGYGFNDEHFNNAIFENTKIPLLVITKSVKKEVVDRLLNNENAVAFYNEGMENFLIYRKENFRIMKPLWDIDEFSNIFFS